MTLPAEGSSTEFTRARTPEIVIAPNGRVLRRNAWSDALHRRNRSHNTTGSAVVRPTEYPYPTVTGTSRRALNVTARFAPTAWRVYALNSERRSAKTAKLAVWRGGRNTGWRSGEVALLFAGTDVGAAGGGGHTFCLYPGIAGTRAPRASRRAGAGARGA